MLHTRVITASIVFAVFLSALFGLPQSAWVLFTFAITMAALWEWSRIAQFTKLMGKIFLGASFLAGMGLVWIFLGQDDVRFSGMSRYAFFAATAAASLFWLGMVPAWLKFGWRPKSICLLAATGWLVIFPTWIAMIVYRTQDPWILLGLMGVVWIADITAYFTGRAFGRHKLAPGISPGKTWEGVAGAMLGVLVYTAICIPLAIRFGGPIKIFIISWPVAMAVSLILVALSIMGDLFESWIKRGAGVKDSSNLLPGHGGVLDRIDALTAVLPVAPLVFLIVAKLIAS